MPRIIRARICMLTIDRRSEAKLVDRYGSPSDMLMDDISSGMEKSTGISSEGSGITTVPDKGEDVSRLPSATHWLSVPPRALTCPTLDGMASTSICGMPSGAVRWKSGGMGNSRHNSRRILNGLAAFFPLVPSSRDRGAVSQKNDAPSRSRSFLNIKASARMILTCREKFGINFI